MTHHPHPLLAALARVGAVLAAAQVVLFVTSLIFPLRPGEAWFGRQVLDDWKRLSPASALRYSVQTRLPNAAGHLLPATGWLLAAGLLRRAATGGLTATGAGGFERLPGLAAAGMAAGLVWSATVVANWAAPTHERWVVKRAKDWVLSPPVRQSGGGWPYITVVPVEYNLTGLSNGTWTSVGSNTSPPADATEVARRVVRVTRIEGSRLLTTLPGSGMVFCLAGVVYCIGRRPDDEAT